jgi:ATP-dependent DNA helicase RecG
LSPEDFLRPHGSRPWNPLIAQTFFRRGIIDQWGRGTLKIVQLTEEAGLVSPEFEERGGEVVVRFFPTQYVPPTRASHELTDLQQRILATLSEHGPMPSTRIREFLGEGIPDNTMLYNLDRASRALGMDARQANTQFLVWLAYHIDTLNTVTRSLDTELSAPN